MVLCLMSAAAQPAPETCADGACKQPAQVKPKQGLQLLQTVRRNAKTFAHTKQQPFVGPAPEMEAPIICASHNMQCFDWELEMTQQEMRDAREVFPSPEEMGVQIVVTRAGEDIRWLDALETIPTIVYNRLGEDYLLPTPRSNLQVVEAENIGREDESMMRHIINNYDSLAEVTIFLQGWPFGHCPNAMPSILNMMKAMANDEDGVTNVLKQGIVPITGTFYKYVVSTGQLGLATSLFHIGEGNSTAMARDVYGATCREVLGGECPDTQWVGEGAQWAVSRERILLRTKQFYEHAIEKGEGYQSKYRGLVMEALWPVVWSPDGWWEPLGYADVPAPNESLHADTHCEAADWTTVYKSLGHCTPRNDSLSGEEIHSTIESCTDIMGYCEIKTMIESIGGERCGGYQMADGAKVNEDHVAVEVPCGLPISDFLTMRQRYEIRHDAAGTAAAGNDSNGVAQRWSMDVDLRPVMLGAAVFLPSGGGSRTDELEDINRTDETEAVSLVRTPQLRQVRRALRRALRLTLPSRSASLLGARHQMFGVNLTVNEKIEDPYNFRLDPGQGSHGVRWEMERGLVVDDEPAPSLVQIDTTMSPLPSIKSLWDKLTGKEKAQDELTEAAEESAEKSEHKQKKAKTNVTNSSQAEKKAPFWFTFKYKDHHAPDNEKLYLACLDGVVTLSRDEFIWEAIFYREGRMMLKSQLHEYLFHNFAGNGRLTCNTSKKAQKAAMDTLNLGTPRDADNTSDATSRWRQDAMWEVDTFESEPQ